MKPKDVAALAALQEEKPTTRIQLLRRLWPDIRSALELGHTLRAVHDRLTESGTLVSYSQLCGCVLRFRLEAERDGTGPVTTGRKAATPQPRGRRSDAGRQDDESTHDPLANVDELLEGKRPGFNYDGRLPDSGSLIG